MSSNGGISGSTSVAAVGWDSSCPGVVKGVDGEADGVDGVADVVDGVTFAASCAAFLNTVCRFSGRSCLNLPVISSPSLPYRDDV